MPATPEVITEFKSWLTELTTGMGSDLHLKVGSPPMIRREGVLHRLDREPLSPEETDVISNLLPLPDGMVAMVHSDNDSIVSDATQRLVDQGLTAWRTRASQSVLIHKVARLEPHSLVFE